MVFRSFAVRTGMQVILLVITAVFCAWSIQQYLYLTFSFLVLLLLAETVWLVYYVQRTNRELAKMLLSIRFSDFSLSFASTGTKDSFQELFQSFNEILAAFKKVRLEKEEQFLYLQKVVEHVSICLIAFDEHGDVEIYNQAVKETLGLNYVRNISDFDRVQAGLNKALATLASGNSQLIKIERTNESKILSLRVEDFIVNKRKMRLASLQDIRNELEQKELETWQKMIRVLTHEIMNSVTPITSLASATIGFLEENSQLKNAQTLTRENMEDALSGLYTIRKRSEGLTNFVQRYRSLMRLPQPQIQEIKVKELFTRLTQLMASDFQRANVSLELMRMPDHLIVHADPELLEQVFINLLKNALQASTSGPHPMVRLSASPSENERGKIILKVSDNGVGISEEIRDKIFIPFFTTKDGGSGIGLSLSQQIIRAHHGSINVYSKDGEGTTVMVII